MLISWLLRIGLALEELVAVIFFFFLNQVWFNWWQQSLCLRYVAQGGWRVVWPVSARESYRKKTSTWCPLGLGFWPVLQSKQHQDVSVPHYEKLNYCGKWNWCFAVSVLAGNSHSLLFESKLNKTVSKTWSNCTASDIFNPWQMLQHFLLGQSTSILDTF